jgi:hypothetical protein
MANTTFTGPVRSEGGFQVVSKIQQLVLIQTLQLFASTGIVTDKYVKHVGFATGVTVNTTAGDSPTIGEFTQPANTIITNIKIFCDTAPVIGTGDIGYEVGTSSSGAQIVAAIADEILDGGTNSCRWKRNNYYLGCYYSKRRHGPYLSSVCFSRAYNLL